MNSQFIKDNFVAISFFSVFNIFTTAIRHRQLFEENERTILLSIAIYEFANIFIELINHYKRSEKQIVLYTAHHIISTCSATAFYCCYKPTQLFHDVVTCAVYICSTNFYLNLQYCFPDITGFKIIFALSFLYYRIILMFPYFVNIIKGSYYIENKPILSLIVCVVPILFCLLNIYWSILIIKKIINKIK